MNVLSQNTRNICYHMMIRLIDYNKAMSFFNHIAGYTFYKDPNSNAIIVDRYLDAQFDDNSNLQITKEQFVYKYHNGDLDTIKQQYKEQLGSIPLLEWFDSWFNAVLTDQIHVNMMSITNLNSLQITFYDSIRLLRSINAFAIGTGQKYYERSGKEINTTKRNYRNIFPKLANSQISQIIYGNAPLQKIAMRLELTNSKQPIEYKFQLDHNSIDFISDGLEKIMSFNQHSGS